MFTLYQISFHNKFIIYVYSANSFNFKVVGKSIQYCLNSNQRFDEPSNVENSSVLKDINNLNDGFEIENGRVRNQIFLNG